VEGRRTATPVRYFPDSEALGDALAQEVIRGIDNARRDGRWYVLGCPGGRSGRSTYQALARRVRGADLRHVVIAMMDEYLIEDADGTLRSPPAGAHYSCRRFADGEIAGPLTAAAASGKGINPDHVWLPDPTDPETYERRLADAGGVDLFIVASGASDGHVAFVPPGSSIDGRTAIIPIADTTRRDNLATFPAFRSLDEVPRHGVSVGLGTIVRHSRSVRLILLGEAKSESAARILATNDFDADWPATFIHRCHDAQIWLDEAADPRPTSADRPGARGR
jgi:glucosamine-6-phosphate deaminase